MKQNKELAKILNRLAVYLKAEKTVFQSLAYQKAAFSIEAMEEDISDIYRKAGTRGLMAIAGVGRGIALGIEEYLKTGKIGYYEKLFKKLPVELEELMAVEGVGPGAVKSLYQNLKIKNLEDLEKAAKLKKIRQLPGFGEKSEKNILEAIVFLKRNKGRFLLGEILPLIEPIYKHLKGLKETGRISLAGSLRRMKETIGDVDILIASSQPKKIMDFFVSLPEIAKVWGKGGTKASVRTLDGLDIDLRVVSEKSYGSALQYFTGSKQHNVALRKIAIGKGLKLNEYGVFKGSKMIAGADEEGIYKTLGLNFIVPEMREDCGEIDLALAGRLPKLVGLKDIKGDLHIHSDWNGGENSILEMAEAAELLGYQYLGISDHTKFLRIEKGLNENQLLAQKKEIFKLNNRFIKKGIGLRLLCGCEANILADGSLDIGDKVLSGLDYVIAGVHSQLKMEKPKMTKRLIKAIVNKNVDIISHPTGRLIQKRNEYQIDIESVFKAAKETGTVLEINSSSARLDLSDKNIRKAKEFGIKMVINSDSHNKSQLKAMNLGVAQSRRGWLEQKDIINTRPLEELVKFFKK